MNFDIFRNFNMVLAIFTFMCLGVAHSQVTCPTLNGPFNNDTNVPVDTEISWTAVVGAPGYIISIGTTPGGTEIVNNRNTGSATTFRPPLGLPANSPIYVTLTVFFFNAENVECASEMFRTGEVTVPPPCNVIQTPADQAENVNVATPIVWEYTPTATSYNLSIGTTTGGGEILNDVNVGNVLSYTPATDFPFNTEIFVTLVPENENGVPTGTCSETSFTTGAAATRPDCAVLLNPAPNSINVPLTPRLEWTNIPDADGYRVTIGMSPNTGEVLDNVTFSTNSTLVLDFDPNRTFFITIIPFNDAGEAFGCNQQTFSTVLGCGPFLDSQTGELVDLSPEIDFPDTLSFCENEVPYTVTTDDVAEGFRWFKVDSNGTETLISTDSSVDITENGLYRYEAYNTVSQSGNTIECDSSKEFTVTSSEAPIINSLDVTGFNGNIQITTRVSGIGDYEYALDDINGPYQDSNSFVDLPFGSYTVYVRDKNGCGIAQESIVQDLTLEGFPKFFTPNGDGINDYWQFIPPGDAGEVNVETIEIYDRYGKFLRQIDPLSLGWDGRLNGKPLPASDYWFRAISLDQDEIRGHFSLKR